VILRLVARLRQLFGLSGAALIAPLALFSGAAVALSTAHPRQAAHGRRTPPAKPLILAKPSRYTDLRWAYFTFTSKTKGVQYQCSLDGGPFRRCPDHIVYGLIEGQRRLAAATCPKAKAKLHKGARRKRCKPLPKRNPKKKRRTQTVCRKGKGKKRLCTVAYIVGAGRPLRLGNHVFRVRVRASSGTLSKPAIWRWTILTKAQLEARLKKTGSNGGGSGSSQPSGRGEGVVPIVRPQQFMIGGSPAGLLSPGGPPLAVPLHLFNPNPVPIVVTALVVSAEGGAPGCSPAENLRITQSNVSPSNPLRLGAGETVVLPTATASAPTIQFLDLPVNQDACKNATFALRYSGTAHT